MRILIELEALKDQTLGTMDYHKIQGFVYRFLIGSTYYKHLHDHKNYKLFCFSNIFPPSTAKVGDKRYILFASPVHALVEAIFTFIKEICEQELPVNVGEQSYKLVSASLLKLRVSSRCVIRTSTPVTVRLSENRYDHYLVPAVHRKQKFLYWRRNLPADIFIESIESNLNKKFLLFNNSKREFIPFINEFMFLREVIVHIPVENATLKIPASFWKFYFTNLDRVEQEFVEFALDTGLGERNSFGLGFINAEQGVNINYLRRAGSQVPALSANNKDVIV